MSALSATAPPPVPPLQRAKQALIAKASALILPLARKAAGAYLGGETVDEALLVCRRLAGEGHAATLGYWDDGRESAADCIALYREAMAALAGEAAYLSLKPPALRFAPEHARSVALAAAGTGLRLHCDSHGPEVAEASKLFAEALLEGLPPEKIGVTLPGRWQRSLADADWAMGHGFAVRVVKGQWPDAHGGAPGAGFLAVIERLASGARLVAVATHDLALARAAVARLRAAKVPCEIEVLLGMPAAPLLVWAKDAGVAVRVYVPYGPGFVPNAIGVLRRNPRLLLAVAKERFGTAAKILGLGARP